MDSYSKISEQFVKALGAIELFEDRIHETDYEAMSNLGLICGYFLALEEALSEASPGHGRLLERLHKFTPKRENGKADIMVVALRAKLREMMDGKKADTDKAGDKPGAEEGATKSASGKVASQKEDVKAGQKTRKANRGKNKR